ncbi:MAG TPA: hypothetical protein ENO00_08300 [Deltaproteobacteria bacterium]|nr:hypothetical protein [Deltaproteobacteria bacterium]
MPPGGEGTITLKVTTRGYGGQNIAKSVTVHTNDQNKPSQLIRISGTIEEFVLIEPKRVRLVGHVETPLQETITIVPTASYPFTVTGIRLRKGEHVGAKLRFKPDGQGYEVEVVNRRRTVGRYYDVVILTTDSTIQRELNINIYGQIIDNPR